MAAVFYLEIKRNKYAINILKKIVSKNHPNPKTHALLGEAYFQDKSYIAALEHYQIAKTMAPQSGELYYFMARAYQKVNNLDHAISHYQTALEMGTHISNETKVEICNRLAELLIYFGRHAIAKDVLEMLAPPHSSRTLMNLARAYLDQPKQASNFAMQAIDIDPQSKQTTALLSLILESDLTPNLISDDARQVISACLKSTSTNPQNFSRFWDRNFFNSPDKPHVHALLSAESYESFATLFSQDEVRTAVHDDFFILGVTTINCHSIPFETLLTRMRRYYLRSEKAKEPQELPFLSALAVQCFNNEYVFDVSQVEQDTFNHLYNSLERKQSLNHDDLHKIILFACYAPLYELGKDCSEYAALSDAESFTALIKLQAKDRIKEKQLQKKIKPFATITNRVSKDVRRQYEENPYPRWVGATFFTPLHKEHIDHAYFKKSDILIAGCGTGKQILQALSLYPHANITAIDLSLSSIAYAKRKLIQLGLDKKTDFYHGDILELEQINKDFDYIECTGVLHHMEDPQAGLNVLSQKLKRGHAINLALYSYTARKNIREAKNIIKEHGFEADINGIRACRSFIKENLAKNSNFKGLDQSYDFYSTSQCRDALFHVQEKQYTIPEIADLLDQAGLTFNEMSVGKHILSDFKATLPEPDATKNLDHWQAYEEKNPNTFSGMYQFLAVKN